MDPTGNLIGTTEYGGKFGIGALFKLIPHAGRWKEKVLSNFCSADFCADGDQPAQIMSDASGHIFGTAYFGGNDNDFQQRGAGTIFEFDGSARTTLYSFCPAAGCSDGEYPFGGLIADGQGGFFGTTFEGGHGSPGNGTIFELIP